MSVETEIALTEIKLSREHSYYPPSHPHCHTNTTMPLPLKNADGTVNFEGVKAHAQGVQK